MSADFLGRLERLQLATTAPLSGRFAGDHRSRRRGTSVDFADYREYHPGDDFRRIDYLMLARLDQVLIKLFESEDDLEVRILIDVSSSMANADKRRMTLQAAAAVAFVSLVRRDAVTIHTFPAQPMPARFTSRAAVPALFAYLHRLPFGGPTAAGAAVGDLLSRGGPGGISVLVSDLMTPEWESAIQRIPARGAAVTVVQVLGAADTDLDAAGDVDLVDVETSERVPVSMVPEVRASYRTALAAWLDRVAVTARRAGANYVRVDPDTGVERTLLTAWREAGVWR